MSEKMNGLKLGMSPATIEYAKPHVPSEIQADTLFTFMRQLDFLLPIIRTAMISPRYCEEDISYLGIEGFKRMAYPMKCFCDINMHRLETHLSWYGYYGIAFSKEWGMRNKIQAVQYINPESELCCDFSRTFSTALKIDSQRQSPSEQQILEDQSCDKPRYTSFLCFKDEEHMKKYEESVDRNISISQFHDAKRAGEYLIVQEE